METSSEMISVYGSTIEKSFEPTWAWNGPTEVTLSELGSAYVS
jgi:hypothetical protein